MSGKWLYPAVLLATGAGWGLTQPLGKIASSTGHLPFGMTFWQIVVCILVLGAITLLRGKSLSLEPKALGFYAIVALLGTVIPGYTFYSSIARLPSGIMSILISTVPMIAFPMALLLRSEGFSAKRAFGLLLGLAGVLLITLPEASLPDRAMVAFLPLALIGPFCYALENTYVARSGLAGMDPIQAMFGTSIAALVLCTPMMLAMGHWFPMPLVPGKAELALIAGSALHGLLYAAFVWLASKTGAVFSSQSAYVTTITGVIWAMVLLGERFSVWVFLAGALMLLGMALVQPRRVPALSRQDH